MHKTRLTALCVAALLGGCETQPPQPQPVQVQPPAERRGPTPAQQRAHATAYFLGRAERALAADDLMTPEGFSAYDYYQRVLGLSPGDQRAISGLQTIVMRYVEKAREALKRRDFGRVEWLLGRADRVIGDSPLVAEVRRRLDEERRTAQALAAPAGAGSGGMVIELSGADLDARSESLSGQLGLVAQRIRANNLRVEIITRSDAEGRWIYSQLRKAVPGYRVRANIRIGPQPRLELQQQ